MFLTLMEAGYGNQILLSHDAGWYHVGEPGGGEFKPYTTLADQFLPAMKKSGVPEQMLDRVVADNPAIAFAVTKS